VVTTSSSVPLPLNFPNHNLTEWLREVAVLERKTLGHLSIQWQSDEELLEVNRQFLDHDYYTDIITFNRNRGTRVQGDLAISIDRIEDHAQSQGISVRDEMLRVVVHGLLHLCGYEDHSEEEKSHMRSLETSYMQLASTYGL